MHLLWTAIRMLYTNLTNSVVFFTSHRAALFLRGVVSNADNEKDYHNLALRSGSGLPSRYVLFAPLCWVVLSHTK